MAEQPGQRDPTTFQKYTVFATSSMKGKLVTDLPGIGKSFGANLKKNGYATAPRVYGQFLVLEGNERLFKEWFKETAETEDSGKAQKCYDALNEWYNRFG